MKIAEPDVKQCVDGDFGKAVEQSAFYNEIYTSAQPGASVFDLTFESCIFKGIDFSEIKLECVDMVDVVFENCNLSNKKFNKQYLSRVKFSNCRMTGISFIDSTLKDVQFIGCRADYINFTQANLKSVSVAEGNFGSMLFFETKIKNLYLNKVDLYGAEIVNTPLSGVDFSKCRLEGIRIDKIFAGNNNR